MILGTESGSKWEIERFPTKNETSDTTERNLYGMFPDIHDFLILLFNRSDIYRSDIPF